MYQSDSGGHENLESFQGVIQVSGIVQIPRINTLYGWANLDD